MAESRKADRNSLRLSLFLSILALGVLGTPSNIRAAQFRAAVVKIDITPDRPQWLLGYDPRQSTGVHDKLYHRIVAMDDGTTQFFLISTEICLFSPAVYGEAWGKPCRGSAYNSILDSTRQYFRPICASHCHLDPIQ